MSWHDTRDRAQSVVPDLIQDITFRIEAKTIPLDHASALSDAVLNRLPWLRDEPQAGIHLINYPESGSGWTREPDSPRQWFFASKRLRLRLRLPKQCLERAKTLIGQKLDLDGHAITIGQTNTLLLVRSSTLFARRVIFEEQESESDFIERVVIELDQMGNNTAENTVWADTSICKDMQTDYRSEVSCWQTLNSTNPSVCSKTDWVPADCSVAVSSYPTKASEQQNPKMSNLSGQTVLLPASL